MSEGDGSPEGGPGHEPEVERFWAYGPPRTPWTVGDLLGTINAAPFLGRPPRTVRFDGYLQDERGTAYLFSVRPGTWTGHKAADFDAIPVEPRGPRIRV